MITNKFIIKAALISFLTLMIGEGTAYSAGKMHNTKQKAAYKIACAKFDNDIAKLYQRISVLKDAQNRRAKQEEIKSIGESIRSSIDSTFDEINSQLAAGTIYPDDSKIFMGKLNAVKRSLENFRF